MKIFQSCRKGNAEIVEALLEAGAQVDSTGMYSWTPLLVAVRGNFPQVVSLLLQHGPNVNSIDQEGLTALAIACKEGSTDIAYQLMAAGAYVNVQGRGGDTNLMLAAKGGHRAIVEALLKRYADVDTKVHLIYQLQYISSNCMQYFIREMIIKPVSTMLLRRITPTSSKYCWQPILI